MPSHHSHKESHASGSKKEKKAAPDNTNDNNDATGQQQSTEGIQLGRWAYEVSHDNLTFAERLEKSAWEDTQKH
ncbi:hypothetical protein HYFRA_00011317 [Hymenoscyphus fraxineus]|uniref:Uncharacterized protein n=1 Tax=Hymenoscyphus fraxineus TaxID=746836 RepID=A0A9N9KWU3_9HELO|nr:hypothetical protein HYFRA_00011317 [Hymenoscyphus fraxineus]